MRTERMAAALINKMTLIALLPVRHRPCVKQAFGSGATADSAKNRRRQKTEAATEAPL